LSYVQKIVRAIISLQYRKKYVCTRGKKRTGSEQVYNGYRKIDIARFVIS